MVHHSSCDTGLISRFSAQVGFLVESVVYLPPSSFHCFRISFFTGFLQALGTTTPGGPGNDFTGHWKSIVATNEVTP
jgi:hypothetical protein